MFVDKVGTVAQCYSYVVRLSVDCLW